MDPVTTVGLIAAIVQLGEVGVKVTRRISDFTSAALADSPPRAFKQILTVLPLITSGLEHLKTDVSAGHLDASGKEALASVVKSCLSDIQDLDSVLDKVLPSVGASRRERYTKTLASFRYDKKVEEIVKTIYSYLEPLTFHQVAHISPRPKSEKLIPAQKAFWLVPFDRNASFVGRDAIFEEIEEQLKVPTGSQPKAVICGLGGIGKSQIALEYCYRRRKENERCSVFWCNAATVARFEESMNSIASECGLLPQGEAKTNAAGLLKTWLESRHEGPWLMVIDNVDDRDIFFKEHTRAGTPPSRCIPQCANGTLLFTTRSRAIAIDVTISTQPIIIHQMGKGEGLELVKKRSPKEDSEDLILELLEVLEYIPLAITQATAFIAKRQKTVQYYLEQYRKSDETKTKLISYEFSDHGRQERSMDSVAKTWMLSFEAIRDENPRAAELLYLMAFFQHQGVPATLLQSEGEDEGHFQDAADLLKEFSFVDAGVANLEFSTHRLVQLATKWWLEREASSETESWAAAALESVAAQFPAPYSDIDSKYFMLCEILLPHAEVMLRYEFKTSKQEVELAKAKLLSSSGRYLYWTGSYREARSRFERSVQMNTHYLGEEHVETMTSTGLLGWVLALCYDDPNSVPILERLVKLRQGKLGNDDPRTIDALSDLAVAISTTGDFAGSEAMQREALARSEKRLGRHHGDTLNCMGHLANVLQAQKDQDNSAEILRLWREIYGAMLKCHGPNHRYVLAVEGSLADALSYRRDTHEEAYLLYKNNNQKTVEVHGQDHRETLVSVANFGDLLCTMDRDEECRNLYVRVLEDIDNGSRRNTATTKEWRKKFQRRLRRLLHGASDGEVRSSSEDYEDDELQHEQSENGTTHHESTREARRRDFEK